MVIPFFGSALRRPPSVTEFSAHTGISGSTPLYTETGPIPAQGLVPGDRVIRRGHGPAVVRSVRVSAHTGAMVRLCPDALGRARPDDFLLLPPDQRLLLRTALGADRDGIFAAHEIVDGDSVRWHEPAAPVMLAHLGFDTTVIVHAGGLELEVPA